MIIGLPLLASLMASGLGVVTVAGVVGTASGALGLYQTYQTEQRRLLQTAASTVSYWYGRFVLLVLLVNGLGLLIGLYLGIPLVRKYGPYIAEIILTPLRASFGTAELAVQTITGAKRRRE